MNPVANAADPLETVPLTFMQKARLLRPLVPLTFVGIICVLIVTVLAPYYGTPPLAFGAVMAVFFLVVGYEALKNLLDLVSGVAIVCDDIVERSWSSRRGNTCWGELRELGTMQMHPNAHHASVWGTRHRIVYSPVSKFIWTATPELP